jgi:hypothetical protein
MQLQLRLCWNNGAINKGDSRLGMCAGSVGMVGWLLLLLCAELRVTLLVFPVWNCRLAGAVLMAPIV